MIKIPTQPIHQITSLSQKNWDVGLQCWESIDQLQSNSYDCQQAGLHSHPPFPPSSMCIANHSPPSFPPSKYCNILGREDDNPPTGAGKRSLSHNCSKEGTERIGHFPKSFQNAYSVGTPHAKEGKSQCVVQRREGVNRIRYVHFGEQREERPRWSGDSKHRLYCSLLPEEKAFYRMRRTVKCYMKLDTTPPGKETAHPISRGGRTRI